MTWNSSCSIASDDENSRHSFLSDCGSEFDLKPAPRYPAEKRSYSAVNKQPINRIEPPLTRSRAKASGQSLITSEPSPKQRRQSGLRRSIDAFTGMATTLTSSLNTSSILFPKQEPSTTSNDRVLNTPLDGVNILADRFESCSIDEGQLNQNCLWPSRETNRHYKRPILAPTSTVTFGATPFSTSNNSPFFAQSTAPPLFGQQQAQLWSRFRYAASTLRDNLWLEQTDLTLQQVPSNIFTSNYNTYTFDQSPTLLSPSPTIPTRLVSSQNRTPSSSTEETSASPPLARQRRSTPVADAMPSTVVKEGLVAQSSPASKIFFTFLIFVIGVVLGCFLTNTLPPGLIWEICAKYFHVFLQTIPKFFASS